MHTLRGPPAVIFIETSRALHGIPLTARDEMVRSLRRVAPLEPDVADRGRSLAEKIVALTDDETIAIDLRDARALVEALEHWSTSAPDHPDLVALERAVEEIVRDADVARRRA